MSFKQILEPAFKKGTLLLHVMECELDFKPLLNHLNEYQYYQKNQLSDFLSVMNQEEGARHTFRIYGFGDDSVCRDIRSSKAGYYGLPTTVIKDGVRVRTFDMSLNSVQNEIGLMFNAYSKNVNILYASSNDIKSRVVMREDGSVNLSFTDTNLFSENKLEQVKGVTNREITTSASDEKFAKFNLELPDIKSLKQNKTVLADLWKNIDEMGSQKYFKTIESLTYHHWNEVLVSAPLSDVAGIFTSSVYPLEIARSVALAGSIMDKLSTDNAPAKALPIVYYKNGTMQEIEITRELFKTENMNSAVGLLDGLSRKTLNIFISKYLDGLEKQQSISK